MVRWLFDHLPALYLSNSLSAAEKISSVFKCEQEIAMGVESSPFSGADGITVVVVVAIVVDTVVSVTAGRYVLTLSAHNPTVGSVALTNSGAG